MAKAETVAEWGERWLAEWCNEADLTDDERKTRAWLAEGWRSWTLETAMSQGWFHPLASRMRQMEVDQEIGDELAVYKGTLHALPVWRLFYYFRSEALPVPEFVLAMFEEWAGRLMRLQHDAAAGKLRGDEGDAILRALQLAGDRKAHLGLKRLALLEGRRRKASDIWRLRKFYGMPWKKLAERFGVTEQAAKDLVYEFEPGSRRRAQRRKSPSMSDLAAAHRLMVRKK